MRRSRWILSVLALCALVALVPMVHRRPGWVRPPGMSPADPWVPVGQSRAFVSVVGDWRLESTARRFTEWDEPPDTVPPDTAGQVYQAHYVQVGPLIVGHLLRVPPRPGENVN